MGEMGRCDELAVVEKNHTSLGIEFWSEVSSGFGGGNAGAEP